jgi:hypothetical protein
MKLQNTGEIKKKAKKENDSLRSHARMIPVCRGELHLFSFDYLINALRLEELNRLLRGVMAA